MNSRKILNTLITIIILILIFRFIGLLIQFWYISIPIILMIYFYFKRKITILSQKIFGANQHSPERTENNEIIDADFTVVENDED